jgi:rhodanese-related sulfurtransferase
MRASRSAFAGAPFRPAARPSARRFAAPFAVHAMARAYPDPDYIAEVLESFPDKMIANPEEARILFTEGAYKYLDVRPELELDATGKVKGCINVPVFLSKWKFDPEQNKKVVEKLGPNENFIQQVKKKIPNLETPIIVGCSDGKTYSLDALGELDEAGYTCLVGLKGGFYAWYKVWDANLRRRRGDGYVEDYGGQGETSCGIHGTGAGFDRVDKVESWVPPTF